ncbi:MAG TPA: acyltransferase [bacterium]|nr:acyltransferase [bacterium]HPN41956.1 acyltransferase [bacterium]
MAKRFKYIRIFTSKHLWLQLKHLIVMFLNDNVWGIINFGKLGKGTGIRPNAVFAFPENIFLGENVIIQRHAYLMAGEKSVIRIGDYTGIGPGAFITASNHGFKKGIPYIEQEATEKDVIIGSDVYIGAQAIVLPGVTIGNGAVIGANAVVTHDIPENAIAVGIPATVKAYRK